MAAIIVVVLGILTANFFVKRGQQIGGGEKVEITDQEKGALGSQDYKIQVGDSLSGIAQKFYGNEQFFAALAKVNKIQNPDLVLADSTIRIPSKEEVEKEFSNLTITSYQVQEGDTLFAIAQKVYGDGSAWWILASANNIGRLPNGNPLILTGTTIQIPR